VRGLLRRIWFWLRGVDPDAVVVTFRSGPADLCDQMEAEFRALIPARRHFVVSPGDKPNFRGLRIGMSAVLFAGDAPGDRALRWQAFLLAPTKILAFNRRLERHHLHWTSPVASLLFWFGVPLDRIWHRPWFWPFRRKPLQRIDCRVIEGRRPSPARAKVSVLTPYAPWPLSHGGAVRLYNLLRQCALEFDVTLFCFYEGDMPEDLDPLRQVCAKIALAPLPRSFEPRWSTMEPPEVHEYRSPLMARLLAEHRAGPLQVEYTQLAGYGGDILVEHDVTFDLYRQVHHRSATLSSWWNLYRWRRFETAALARYTSVVVMSEKDRALTGRTDATVIPNGVDLERFLPRSEPAGTRRLLFIGSFRHFPNMVAFQFLTKQVLPLVRNAGLTVVAGPDPLLHWRSFTGDLRLPGLPAVDMHEFVADVRPLYEQSNLVVVPTLESAGTNLKVLEAMAMQRAVVSTSSGCAGLDLTDGVHIRIADGATAFAAAVNELLDSVSLRRQIAGQARAIAEERFAWQGIGKLQSSLWHKLAPAPLTFRDSTPAEAGKWHGNTCSTAVLDGRPVGLLATRTVAPGEHEILYVETVPHHRGQGIARILLAQWLDQLSSSVFLEVRESNLPARRLYESLGFTLAGIRPAYYSDPEEPGIVMRFQKC